MSPFHAALGSMLLGLGVGMTMIGRSWPAPSGARRRRGDDISNELMAELLGPHTPYTTGFAHAPGVIRQGFDDCPNCDQTTAGVLTRDGWTCGECLTPTSQTTIHTTAED